MSEQPPAPGWQGEPGREQYQPSYGTGPSGQPSYGPDPSGRPLYQAASGQPPWESAASGGVAPGGVAPGGVAPGGDVPVGQPRAPAGQPARSAGRGTAGHDAGRSAGSGHGGQWTQLPIGEARGFVSALFDFGFTSFVTPKVIKVLYILIVIVAALSALAFAVSMLAVNLAFGLVVLLIGAPLFFLVVTAFSRVTLEFFMVIFQMAEDIRALRERGEIR